MEKWFAKREIATMMTELGNPGKSKKLCTYYFLNRWNRNLSPFCHFQVRRKTENQPQSPERQTGDDASQSSELKGAYKVCNLQNKKPPFD